MDTTWRKSSYSASHGGNCVEVAADWRTSSYSGGPANSDCVEWRTERDRVLVRDTQNRPLGHLTFTPEAWTALLGAVRNNEL